MPDQWTEISSNDRHATYAMTVPGGALIRHTEHEDGAVVAASVCFVPSVSGEPLKPSQFPASDEPAEERARSAFFIDTPVTDPDNRLGMPG